MKLLEISPSLLILNDWIIQYQIDNKKDPDIIEVWEKMDAIKVDSDVRHVVPVGKSTFSATMNRHGTLMVKIDGKYVR